MAARGKDIREVIADLNPILRGWGNYFRTGNAANKFIQIDRYVVWRLTRPDASSATAATCAPARRPPGRASGSRLTASTACVGTIRYPGHAS